MPGDKKQHDIYERIYQFILCVLLFIRYIPKTAENLVAVGQIGRSVTSMGANSQEADGAESKNDFVHKFSVVRKETKETKFWLRLLGDLNPTKKSAAWELIQEAQEIINIISSIIQKTKAKRQ